MSIQTLHDLAELSQASYADLSLGQLDSEAQKSKLADDADILTAQSDNLASRYSVALATYNEPNSSFSATVFKNSASGELTLAIRGSGGADWITTNPDIYSHGD